MSNILEGYYIRQRIYVADVAEKLMREEFPNPTTRILGVVVKGGSAATAGVVFWNAISSVVGLPFFQMAAAANTVRSSFGQTASPTGDVLGGGSVTNPTLVAGGVGSFPFPLGITSFIDGLAVAEFTIKIVCPLNASVFIFYTTH